VVLSPGGLLPRYLIRIRVDDLVIKMDGRETEVAAFATRVTKSPNATTASEAVTERVLREVSVFAINPAARPPRLEVEVVREIGPLSHRILPPSGFTFSVWDEEKTSSGPH
jgi:hypothetical protein